MSSRRTPHAVLVSALVALSGATSARADDRALPDADTLFREGRRAADAGDYTLACAKFAASKRIDPAPGTMLNLADCEEARGELTRAWHDFLELADGLPDGDERKIVALVRARKLEKSMPRLRVRLAKSSEGARVHRDDVELTDATLGVAMPVDPGRHVIVVTEGGRRDNRYSVDVSLGEEKDVEIEHGATTGNARRAVGLTLLSVGLASLTAGATSGAFALSNLATSNAECTGNVCASEDGVTHYDRARTFAVASDVTLGIGAALVISGIIVLVTHGGHH
jgi:hypothetical protein